MTKQPQDTPFVLREIIDRIGGMISEKAHASSVFANSIQQTFLFHPLSAFLRIQAFISYLSMIQENMIYENGRFREFRYEDCGIWPTSQQKNGCGGGRSMDTRPSNQDTNVGHFDGAPSFLFMSRSLLSNPPTAAPPRGMIEEEEWVGTGWTHRPGYKADLSPVGQQRLSHSHGAPRRTPPIAPRDVHHHQEERRHSDAGSSRLSSNVDGRQSLASGRSAAHEESYRKNDRRGRRRSSNASSTLWSAVRRFL